MKVERLPTRQARGQILAQNVFEGGRRILRKGHTLTADSIKTLESAGYRAVFVVTLARDDVDENTAADRIARALAAAEPGLEPHRPATTGRVNLRATCRGVLRIDVDALIRLNSLPGVTLATPRPFTVVDSGTVGTLKIIPMALSDAIVMQAEQIAVGRVITVSSLQPRRVRIVAVGQPDQQHRLIPPFLESLTLRLNRLGTTDVASCFVPLAGEEESLLATTLSGLVHDGAELVIVVGDTPTMHEDDCVPLAIQRAGGEVSVLGAPVFPGNLLLVGRIAGTAILGAPGCARDRAANVVDLVLPRLLTGERLDRRDIAELGLGGLL